MRSPPRVARRARGAGRRIPGRPAGRALPRLSASRWRVGGPRLSSPLPPPPRLWRLAPSRRRVSKGRRRQSREEPSQAAEGPQRRGGGSWEKSPNNVTKVRDLSQRLRAPAAGGPGASEERGRAPVRLARSPSPELPGEGARQGGARRPTGHGDGAVRGAVPGAGAPAALPARPEDRLSRTGSGVCGLGGRRLGCQPQNGGFLREGNGLEAAGLPHPGPPRSAGGGSWGGDRRRVPRGRKPESRSHPGAAEGGGRAPPPSRQCSGQPPAPGEARGSGLPAGAALGPLLARKAKPGWDWRRSAGATPTGPPAAPHREGPKPGWAWRRLQKHSAGGRAQPQVDRADGRPTPAGHWLPGPGPGARLAYSSGERRLCSGPPIAARGRAP